MSDTNKLLNNDNVEYSMKQELTFIVWLCLNSNKIISCAYIESFVG